VDHALRGGGSSPTAGSMRTPILDGPNSLRDPTGLFMATNTPQSQSFRIERHGDIAVIIPSPEVESMHEHLIQQAAQMVLAPLREDPPAGIVIDLSQVSYFGSVFLSFLLRCHMLAKKQGSEVVLAGASERTRELLHLTALDTLWALYQTRAEALAALGGAD
jgi:anti-anti-sigma factor